MVRKYMARSNAEKEAGPTHNMNMALQLKKIQAKLVEIGINPDDHDILALMHSNLNYNENLEVIKANIGVSKGTFRNQWEEVSAERSRKSGLLRERRQSGDPLWQATSFHDRLNLEMDRRLPALPPGRRISQVTGKRYYERRFNRTDKSGESGL
jgi:hypothetical protein